MSAHIANMNDVHIPTYDVRIHPKNNINTFHQRTAQLSTLLSGTTQSIPSTQTTTTAMMDPQAEQLKRITRLTKTMKNRQRYINLPNSNNNENNMQRVQLNSLSPLHKTNNGIPKFNELTFSPKSVKYRPVTAIESTPHHTTRSYTITNPFLYVGVSSHSSRLQNTAQLYSTKQHNDLLPSALPAASSHAHLPPIPTKYRIQRSINDVLSQYSQLYHNSIIGYTDTQADELEKQMIQLDDHIQYRVHKQQSAGKSMTHKLHHCVDMINSPVVEYDDIDSDSTKPVFSTYKHVYHALTLDKRCKTVADNLLLQHEATEATHNIGLNLHQIQFDPQFIQSIDQHRQFNHNNNKNHTVQPIHTIDLSSLQTELANTQRLIARHGRITASIRLSIPHVDDDVRLYPISIVLSICNLGCMPTSIRQYDIDLNKYEQESNNQYELNVINVQTELLQIRCVLQDDSLAALPAIDRAAIATQQCSIRLIQHSTDGRCNKSLILPYSAIVDTSHLQQYGIHHQSQSYHQQHRTELLRRHEKSRDIRVKVSVIFDPT